MASHRDASGISRAAFLMRRADTLYLRRPVGRGSISLSSRLSGCRHGEISAGGICGRRQYATPPPRHMSRATSDSYCLARRRAAARDADRYVIWAASPDSRAADDFVVAFCTIRGAYVRYTSPMPCATMSEIDARRAADILFMPSPVTYLPAYRFGSFSFTPCHAGRRLLDSYTMLGVIHVSARQPLFCVPAPRCRLTSHIQASSAILPPAEGGEGHDYRLRVVVASRRAIRRVFPVSSIKIAMPRPVISMT